MSVRVSCDQHRSRVLGPFPYQFDQSKLAPFRRSKKFYWVTETSQDFHRKINTIYINVNADLTLRQSEIVKEEHCLKLRTGYSCKDNLDDSELLLLTSFEALNQIVGVKC